MAELLCKTKFAEVESDEKRLKQYQSNEYNAVLTKFTEIIQYYYAASSLHILLRMIGFFYR